VLVSPIHVLTVVSNLTDIILHNEDVTFVSRNDNSNNNNSRRVLSSEKHGDLVLCTLEETNSNNSSIGLIPSNEFIGILCGD